MRYTLLFALLCFFQNALFSQLDLETSVPSNWSASSGTLAISSNHYKLTSQSLEWQWVAGDTLTVSNPTYDNTKILDFYYHTLTMWLYSNNFTTGTIKVEFVDASSTVQFSFDIQVLYTGWRRIVRSYKYDMSGPASNTVFTKIRFIAPSSGSGSLFFDDIEWVKARQTRYRSEQMPDISGYLSDTMHYYFNNLSADISQTTPTSTELKEIDSIKASYIQDVAGSAPSSASVTAAQNTYNTFNIVVSGSDIKGKPFDNTNISEVNDIILILARDYYHTNDSTSKGMALRLVRHLIDQGFAGGSDLVLYGSNSYKYRNVSDAMILLEPEYGSTLKSDVGNELTWQQQIGAFWDPNWIPGVLTDHLHTYSERMIGNMLYFSASNDEIVQLLKGFKRYIFRSLSESPSTRGGIKADGTCFHHNTFYPAYMYALESLSKSLYHLRETSFQIDLTTYNQLKLAINTLLIVSNPLQYAVSLSGRQPFQSYTFPIGKTTMQRIGIFGGDILGTTIDTAVAATYNRIWNDYPPFSSVTAEANPNGFWAYNYSPVGIYRKSDWLVNIKGMNSAFWGAEIYSTENRYGRYQSYGTLEVLYHGGLDSSGYDINGWDWNKIPGTTTIHLPWTKLLAEKSRIDEKSALNFAGAVTLGDSIGLYAVNFQEANLGANHNTSFVYRKSMFCVNGKIICLGSGISNDNTSDSTATNLFQNQLSSTSKPITVNGTSVPTFPYSNTLNGSSDNWVMDAFNTGYWVESGDEIIIKRKNQTSPSETGTGNTTGDFATAYINHGTSPSLKSYQFVVMPKTNSSNMATFNTNMQSASTAEYSVIQQDTVAHIVQDNKSNVRAYAIFEADTSLSDTIIDRVDKACLVLVRTVSPVDTLRFSIVDPDLNISSDGVSESPFTVVRITVHGQWSLSSGDAYVIAQDASTTTLLFKMEDGFSKTVTLTPGVVTQFSGDIGTGGVIASRVFWLDAEDMDGDFDRTNGSQNGADITFWIDKSGNYYNASAPGSERPVLDSTGMNGIPTATFDGSQRISIGSSAQSVFSFLHDGSGATVFVVSEVTGDSTTTTYGILGTDIVSSNKRSYSLSYLPTSQLKVSIEKTPSGFYLRKTLSNYTANPVITSTTHKDVSSGDDLYVYKNNGLLNSYATSNTPASGAPTQLLTIGGYRPTSPSFVGNISEVIMYDTVLSEASRNIVSNYLSAKWGIAISNDLYNGDQSANGDYDMDVIGIGHSASGNHTYSGQAGLTLTESANFTNGDYLLAGHNVVTNSTNISDISGVPGLEGRWNRVWYFDVTDSSATMQVDVGFDFYESHRGSPGVAANYVLLYRAGQTGAWTALSSIATISGNVVSFNNVSLTNDGYYTLGSIDLNTGILPLDILTFEAVPFGKDVRAWWTILLDVNTDYFVVERSLDGKKWEGIVDVNIGTYKVNPVTFNVFDTDPVEGYSYYRLKVFNTNKKFVYSNISSVYFNQKELDIQVYPNPASKWVRLVSRGHLYNPVLEIYNMTGVLFRKSQLNSASQWTIPISELPAQPYLFVLRIGAQRITKVVLIER